MAVLTNRQLARFRRDIAESLNYVMDVTFSKQQINDALQALEDWFESSRGARRRAVNDALSPATITKEVRHAITTEFLRDKVERDRKGGPPA